jgi:osmotically-inducible protein OsmY
VIGSKIKAKFVKAKEIHSLNIDVDVNKRIVTLSGVVKYQNQKDVAMGIARRTLGVVDVNDSIIVEEP